MKLTHILEADVDYSFAGRQKDKQDREVGAGLQAIKAVQRDIDSAIAVSIDRLMENGIDEQHARGVVFKHLSDLVMAEDIK